jgi:glyoxylase-like metal-dependent hydrolase (beta-lactamase superfamily II)
MKRRYILAISLSLLGLVATYPWVSPEAEAPIVTGSIGRPFASGRAAATRGQTPAVSLAIVGTSAMPVPEAMVIAGGSLTREVTIGFSGFLIRHGTRTLAFDLGLGSQIDHQYAAEMPLWARLGFAYAKPVNPMARQLARAGQEAPTDILLSHTHWDHGSGLEDFRNASVWIPSQELALIRASSGGAGQPWMSQVGRKGIRWQQLTFPDGSFGGFEASLDLFGDRTVVAVPMPGHTTGAVALFVTVSSGRRFLLVGDTIWNLAQLKPTRGKFLGASMVVDGDPDQTASAIEKLARLAANHPGLEIVPAHDGDAQKRLGLFPKWLN